MALPTKKEIALKPVQAGSNQNKNSPVTPKKADVLDAGCQEAIVGCVLLAKLRTKKGNHFQRISQLDVLKLMADLQHSRLRVDKVGGNDSIVQEVGTSEERTRVSLVLKIGSVQSLMKAEKDDPSGCAAIINAGCKQVNDSNESKLLKLIKTDVNIQSDQISPNKQTARLILKGGVILFA
jgi:hypothetical protein